MQKTKRLFPEQIEMRIKESIGSSKVTVESDLVDQISGQEKLVVKVTPESEEEVSEILRTTYNDKLVILPCRETHNRG